MAKSNMSLTLPKVNLCKREAKTHQKSEGNPCIKSLYLIQESFISQQEARPRHNAGTPPNLTIRMHSPTVEQNCTSYCVP